MFTLNVRYVLFRMILVVLLGFVHASMSRVTIIDKIVRETVHIYFVCMFK